MKIDKFYWSRYQCSFGDSKGMVDIQHRNKGWLATFLKKNASILLVNKLEVSESDAVMPDWIRTEVQNLRIICDFSMFERIARHVVVNDPEEKPLDSVLVSAYSGLDWIQYPLVRTARHLDIQFHYKPQNSTDSLVDLFNPSIFVRFTTHQITNRDFAFLVHHWLIRPRNHGTSLCITKRFTRRLIRILEMRHIVLHGYNEVTHGREVVRRPCIFIPVTDDSYLKIWGYRHRLGSNKKRITAMQMIKDVVYP
uniref:FBA_2 domain-containing protein n=2 Tax=Caenorhabditis tropicalis TaxID=1561998 RepID=A0A1I7TGW9_9PELO